MAPTFRGRPATGGARVSPWLPRASSVLVVCAHPDDESFGLGGVLHSFVTGGASVSVLCFTHGEASTLSNTAGALGEVRVLEMKAAADELGVREVELLDHPDGALRNVPLERLAGRVRHMARRVEADLLLVFDEGGVTGHPDHRRATQAALAGAGDRPVLAWTVPTDVAATLRAEFGTSFVGRDDNQVDIVIHVDRDRQRQAIRCHVSQCTDNPVLWRRLALMEDREALRWLRAPPGGDRQRVVADPLPSRMMTTGH